MAPLSTLLCFSLLVLHVSAMGPPVRNPGPTKPNKMKALPLPTTGMDWGSQRQQSSNFGWNDAGQSWGGGYSQEPMPSIMAPGQHYQQQHQQQQQHYQQPPQQQQAPPQQQSPQQMPPEQQAPSQMSNAPPGAGPGPVPGIPGAPNPAAGPGALPPLTPAEMAIMARHHGTSLQDVCYNTARLTKSTGAVSDEVSTLVKARFRAAKAKIAAIAGDGTGALVAKEIGKGPWACAFNHYMIDPSNFANAFSDLVDGGCVIECGAKSLLHPGPFGAPPTNMGTAVMLSQLAMGILGSSQGMPAKNTTAKAKPAQPAQTLYVPQSGLPAGHGGLPVNPQYPFSGQGQFGPPPFYQGNGPHFGQGGFPSFPPTRQPPPTWGPSPNPFGRRPQPTQPSYMRGPVPTRPSYGVQIPGNPQVFKVNPAISMEMQKMLPHKVESFINDALTFFLRMLKNGGQNGGPQTNQNQGFNNQRPTMQPPTNMPSFNGAQRNQRPSFAPSWQQQNQQQPSWQQQNQQPSWQQQNQQQNQQFNPFNQQPSFSPSQQQQQQQQQQQNQQQSFQQQQNQQLPPWQQQNQQSGPQNNMWP